MMKAPLVLCAVLLMAIPASGQFVDEGKNGAPPAVAQNAAPNPAAQLRETMARTLVRLKGEREEAAAKFGKDSAEIVPLDKAITALRTQLALTDQPEPATGLGDSLATTEIPMAPVFPRIVPIETAAADPAAGSAALQPGLAQQSAADQTNGEGSPYPALNKSLISIAADKTPLVKVLDSIRAQARVNMEINWQALEAAGVDRNAPVTMTLADVSMEDALRAVLTTAGGPTASLDFTTDDGIVIVSTRDDLASTKYQSICAYNVTDLLAVPQSYAMPANVAAQIYEARAENMANMIKSLVAPDTWRDNGGTIGSIREFDGLFVVNQTKQNHLLIERFLSQLRASHAARN